MAVILWQLQISHYNEKVRWALAYKRIPHERRAPMPGMHRLHALALTRGREERLPVVKLEGARPVGDSTAIIAALERYKPEPALYPRDPEARRRALELEEYFDEEVGPRVRRLFFHRMLPDREATLDAVMQDAGRFRRAVARATTPAARALIRRDIGVDDDRAAEALAGVRDAMELLEREIGPGGYLVGDRFTVADLSAAALMTPVLAPPGREYAPKRVTPGLLELREELGAREGGRWVADMYARHRGGTAEAAPTP